MGELARGLLVALDVLLAFWTAAAWVMTHDERVSPTDQDGAWVWCCWCGTAAGGLTIGLLAFHGLASLRSAFNALVVQFEVVRGALALVMLVGLLGYALYSAWQLRRMNLARRALNRDG